MNETMLSLHKFNKVKEIIKELLANAVKKSTTPATVKKDIALIMSYIKFAIVKGIEHLDIIKNKTKKIDLEKIEEYEIEYSEISEIKRSLQIIFLDHINELEDLIEEEDDLDDKEKLFMLMSWSGDLDVFLIKTLNQIKPVSIIEKEVKRINYEPIDIDYNVEMLFPYGQNYYNQSKGKDKQKNVI